MRLCHKIGQGQPKVVMYTNYDRLDSPMLQKLVHWILRFFSVFYHLWHGGHLDNVTCIFYTNFCSPFPRRIHIKFSICK